MSGLGLAFIAQYVRGFMLTRLYSVSQNKAVYDHIAAASIEGVAELLVMLSSSGTRLPILPANV